MGSVNDGQGHGHVTPRPDGAIARCGGPMMCGACARELAAKSGTEYVPIEPPFSMPSVGRIVHYTSYGTPGGEYTSQCRAAMVTEVGLWLPIGEPYDHGTNVQTGQRTREVTQVLDPTAIGVQVVNPTGTFYNQVRFSDGMVDGRFEGFPGGTWHWPERV